MKASTLLRGMRCKLFLSPDLHFYLFVRTVPKHLSYMVSACWTLCYAHLCAAHLTISLQASKSQHFFRYTKYSWQAKERMTSVAGDDSLLSSCLVQLSLFFRHQIHFHLKMKQSKHFLLRPSTQLIQLPKSTSKASSIHHPLCGHLRTHQTLVEAGQHQSLLFCQEPGEQYSSHWLSTNREILRSVS